MTFVALTGCRPLILTHYSTGAVYLVALCLHDPCEWLGGCALCEMSKQQDLLAWKDEHGNTNTC